MDIAFNHRPAGPFGLAWHTLAVGALMLVWYGVCLAKFGIAGETAPMFGGWTQTFVTASVLGGLAGGALLLLRSPWSVQALTVTLVGLTSATASLFIFSVEPHNLYAMPTMLGMWLISLTTLLYASRVQPLDLGRFEVLE